MCHLSYISTLGQVNDKELRFKTQKCQSVKQIIKTHFTYHITGLILGNARMVIPYETRTQTDRQTSETIGILTSKLRYAVASLR
jgi:hypothetical protein